MILLKLVPQPTLVHEEAQFRPAKLSPRDFFTLSHHGCAKDMQGARVTTQNQLSSSLMSPFKGYVLDCQDRGKVLILFIGSRLSVKATFKIQK